MNTKRGAKRILIYGDSLTWGRIPESTERYDEETRYTCVLQKELGDDFEVIAEGLRGRMVYGENARLPHRDGFDSFPGIFLSHTPLNLVVFLLGTNDTQKIVDKTAKQIVSELEKYIPVITKLSKETHTKTSDVLFIAPPIVQKKYLKSGTKFENAEEKSGELVDVLENMSKKNSILFFNSNNYISTSKKDGVHLTEKGNLSLGKALAKHIRSL